MKALVIIGVVLVVIYGLARVEFNESVKHNPPETCQLLGGTWTVWDGWRC